MRRVVAAFVVACSLGGFTALAAVPAGACTNCLSRTRPGPQPPHPDVHVPVTDIYRRDIGGGRYVMCQLFKNLRTGTNIERCGPILTDDDGWVFWGGLQ